MNLSGLFAVKICDDSLPWLFFLFFFHVSKSFLQLSRYHLHGSKPFLYLSKTYLFVRFYY